MVAAQRSRVQFHGNKNHKKKSKLHFVYQKHEKAPISSMSETTAADAGQTKRRVDKASNRVKSAAHGARLDSDDDHVGEEGLMFSKKRVASTVELASMGNLRSSLGAAVAESDSSTTVADSASEIEWAESPWASLILPTIPAKEVVSEPQYTAVQSLEPPFPPTRKSSLSTSSWLRNIVTLFAGRKKPSKLGQIKTQQKQSPAPSGTTKDPDQPENNEFHTKSIEHLPTPPQSPSAPPKLLLNQAIPRVWAPDARDPAYQTGFKDEPPAPQHSTFGNMKVAEDIFTPVNIQHGFDAPTSPTLKDQRNQSELNFTDLKNDKWVQWHKEHPRPETNPFSRVCSEENMTDHDKRSVWRGQCGQSEQAKTLGGASYYDTVRV